MGKKLIEKQEVITKNPLEEHYKNRYGFTYPPSREAKIKDSIQKLEELVSREKYQARKRVYNERLQEQRTLHRDYELCEILQAEIINIDLRYYRTLELRANYHTKYELDKTWVVSREGVFIGGIESEAFFIRNTFSRDETGFKSLYIGHLPDNVKVKYEEAKKYIDRNRICVASKNSKLFSMRSFKVEPEPPPWVSPLLIAQPSTGNILLLAAWGLEHELPKSLGGLLEEGKVTEIEPEYNTN